MNRTTVIFLWYALAALATVMYGINVPWWLWLWPVLGYALGYVGSAVLLFLGRLIH